MRPFFGVLAYEYRMSIQRKAALVVAGIFTLIYLILYVLINRVPQINHAWEYAGRIVWNMNIFFPVVAGAITADRAARDTKLKVRELLQVSTISNTSYVLGKYTGAALSILTIQFGILLVLGLATLLTKDVTPAYLLYLLAASVVINVPSLLFVTAWSMALPLLMPLRVYQILFAGYWYWGNFLNSKFIPTISNTLLNASGKYASNAFFNMNFGTTQYLAKIALTNIAVLLAFTALALILMERIISIKEQSGKQR